MLALLLALSACGSSSSESYFYSVDVFNYTDAPITVRYDWEEIWWFYEWLGEDTIQPGNRKIIEWHSENSLGEQIEVEYQGKKKLYTVPQLGSVTVTVQNFQN